MKKYIIIAAVALFVGALAYLIWKSNSRVENEFVFPETIEIVENVGIENIDKYSAIILHEILEIDTMHLSIAKMPNALKVQGGVTMAAWIQQDPFKPNKYMILWNTDIKTKYRYTLAHELYHLHQMERGDLWMYPGEPYVIWEGDTVDFFEVPYNQRPHEVEAHAFDGRVARDLDKLLYE